jgi:hypothetical protein
MSNAIQVAFNNQTITAFMNNDAPVVAMKPIVENMGLDWRAQRQRILRHPVLSTSVVMITTQIAEDDQNREFTCLPLDMLNGWLFGVDSNRVKPELKERVIAYQRECFKALSDYFGFGKQQPTLSAPERKTKQVLIGGLTADQQDAIKALVKARAEALPQDKRAKATITMWSAVKTKYKDNVEKYKNYKSIPPEEYGNVISLIARVPLEGEFIAATDAPKAIEAPTIAPTPAQTFAINRTEDWHSNFQQGQEAVNAIRMSVCTGNAQLLDKVKYAMRNAQAQIYKVDFCADGISTGYIDMVSRYAIIGMQACATPLLVSRI